jgi:3-phenylpropionate/trans-cinnamate dioxygenase ferredoxin reductase subunit
MLGRAEDYARVPFFWTMQAGTSVKYAGFAGSVDAVVYRGDVEEGKFVAGFYNDDGQLMAVVGAGMSREFIACAELLQRGHNLRIDQLEDADLDLPGLVKGA